MVDAEVRGLGDRGWPSNRPLAGKSKTTGAPLRTHCQSAAVEREIPIFTRRHDIEQDDWFID